MNKPKIIAYLKPSCGWSNGVRAVLRKYDLPYEDRDIINDPVQRQEMIEKSGQMLSPCVEINGHMLPDISGEEVEAWMLANKVVEPNNRQADAPTNQPCAHEMPGAPLNFGARRYQGFLRSSAALDFNAAFSLPGDRSGSRVNSIVVSLRSRHSRTNWASLPME